jgi:hypothetical protein
MARGSWNLVKQVIGNFLGQKRKVRKSSLPLGMPPEKCHCGGNLVCQNISFMHLNGKNTIKNSTDSRTSCKYEQCEFLLHGV